MEEFRKTLSLLERINVRVAGWGGQGILLFGFLFGDAAIKQGLFAVQNQQYGPESRGTPVKTDVVISTKPIQFPLFKKLDVLIAFNQEVYSQQYSHIRPGGLILIDSSMVKEYHDNPMIHPIPATNLAIERFNNKQLANLIMLGFLQKHLSPIIEESIFFTSIREAVGIKFVSQDLDAFVLGKAWLEDLSKKC